MHRVARRFRFLLPVFIFSALLPLTLQAQQRFNDVAPTYWAYNFIQILGESGVTAGCGGGNYCPQSSVRRSEMAVFLERIINGSSFVPPAATGNVFGDVGANDFAAAFIEQLFADGITNGCGDGNYCPNDDVSRAQMAVFLLRAKYGSAYRPPAATGVFPDVAPGNFAADWIEQLAAEGITSGCGGGNYCPTAPVTRAQMAVFLVRTGNLTGTPPSATPINPVNLETNVALNVLVAAAFDEDVSSGTVNNTSFRLTQGAAVIPAAAALETTSNIAKLSSDKTLSLLTDYAARLSSDIEDLSGNPLSETAWSFKTRDGNWNPTEAPLENYIYNEASEPQVAADGNGNAISVWVQRDGPRGDIWARRFTPENGWEPPQLIETDNIRSARNPKIAMNEDGNAVVVWEYRSADFTDTVMARRYVAGVGWDFLIELDVDPTLDSIDSQPSISISANGDAVAAWSKADGSGWFDVWARVYTASTDILSDAEQLDLPDTDSSASRVAMDANGNAFVTWYQEDVNTGFTSILGARYDSNTGWDDAVQLNSYFFDVADQHQIAADANGNAIAVWQQQRGDFEEFDTVWASRYENDKTFASYIFSGPNFNVISGTRFESFDFVFGSMTVDCDLAGGSGDCISLPAADYTTAVASCQFRATGFPELVISCADALPGYSLSFETDALGAILSYSFALESSSEGGDGARIEINDGGGFAIARTGAIFGEGEVDFGPGSWEGPVTSSWGARVLLQSVPSDGALPEVAMNAAGKALVVWDQLDFDGQDVWSRRFDPVTGWANSEAVSTTADAASSASVTVDTSGNAMVVYAQDGGATTSDLWARRFVAGGSWGSPRLIETNDAGGAFVADLAVDGYGNIFSVWDQIDGSWTSVFYNRLGGGGEPGGKRISDIQFGDPVLGACVQAAADAFLWTFSQEATDLDCSDLGIQTLVGLETFTNLRTLDLGGNSIVDLSLIERFELLEEIGLSNIPSLENIDPLASLEQLSLVDIGSSGNGVLDCGVINALSANLVTVIEPATCRQRIADVALPDPALNACAARSGISNNAKYVDELLFLDCSRDSSLPGAPPPVSDLTGIDIFSNLIAVNLTSNRVSDLGPLAALDNLKSIDASLTDVQNLASLAGAPALETLTLNSTATLYNPQLGEDPTGISILASFPMLREVYLNERDYSQQIFTGSGQIDCSTLDALESSLDVLGRPQGCNMPLAEVLLEITDVNLNQCVQDTATSQGWTDTHSFTSLNCQSRGISDLTGLERFSSLSSLFLSQNPITDLAPINGGRFLEILYVHNSSIVDFDALTDLIALRDLRAYNVASLVDISELLSKGRLSYVDLGGSGTGQIPCADLDLLREVVLGNSGGIFVPSAQFQVGNCSGAPPLPPAEGRSAKLNTDGTDDLLLQFEAVPGSMLTPSWTTGLASSGSFVEGTGLPGFNTAIYSRARAAGFADANGNVDDFDDLLLQLDVAGSDTVEIRAYFSDGAGGFSGSTGPIVLPTGGIDNARAIAFKDVDNDGNADVLVEQQVTVGSTFPVDIVEYLLYRGNGSGFLAPTPVGFFDDLEKGRPRIIALEDVNDDGYSDLVYDAFQFTDDIQNRHCFGVRLYNAGPGNFSGGLASRTGCTPLLVSGFVMLDHASVADITGSGRKELVVSFNSEMDGNRVGDRSQIVGTLTLDETGPSARWGDFVTVFGEIAPEGTITEYRTVAVADINNDRRADVVIESTNSSGEKSLITYLARRNPTNELFLRDPSFVGGVDDLQAIGLFNYDGDADSLPDMLFRKYDTVSQTYDLYVATNNGSSLNNSSRWYQSAMMPGVIGIEEDGLTNLANDTTELIGMAGDTKLYTASQFSELLRIKDGLTLLRNTQLDTSIEVEPGQCVMAYGEADAGGANPVDGFNQYKAQAKFATLSCTVELADGRINLQTRLLYGGCAATAGIAGVGAKCEVGTVAAKVKFDLSPPGLPNSAVVEADVKGPNAGACAEITLTNLCAGAEASVATASAGVEVAGVGAGVGGCVSCVGANFQLGFQDGQLNGVLGGALFFGVEVDFSINPEQSAKTIITAGEAAYTFGEASGEFVIYTAGPAVFDAASFAANGLLSGADAGFTIARTGAGQAVAFIDATAGDAEVVIIIFAGFGAATAEEIFNALEEAFIASAGEASGFFVSIGSGTLSGVRWIGKKLAGLF